MLLHLLQDPQAQQEAAKTAGKTAEEAGKVDIGGTILHHITNSNELELPFLGIVKLPHFDPVHIGGLTIDLSPSKHVVMMWIVALEILNVRNRSKKRNCRKNLKILSHHRLSSKKI